MKNALFSWITHQSILLALGHRHEKKYIWSSFSKKYIIVLIYQAFNRKHIFYLC